jgi:hypothetical protein
MKPTEITQVEKDTILYNQNCACAVCQQPFVCHKTTGRPYGGSARLDCDPKTGHIRGYLCRRCASTINAAALTSRAKAYLRQQYDIFFDQPQ